MFLHSNLRESWSLAVYLAKWLAIAAALGTVIGSAVAFFLWSLERATEVRFGHPQLVFALPLAGFAIGLLYLHFGRSVERGNNLILDQIHEPSGGVPLRMAPLVLIGTVVTHLFGGSAGREGTAVQIGASLAGDLRRWLPLPAHDSRTLLMAGVAAGFGAVFGTPLAGAVFAMEVLAIGRISYESLAPCLAASIVGDCTVRAWGISHSRYCISVVSAGALTSHPPLSWGLMLKVAVAAIAFGMASVLFGKIAHGFQRLFASIVPWSALRPALGGLVVVGMVVTLGTRDYLGLGTTAPLSSPGAVTIQSCFTADGATWWSWWWKLLFTAVTLGSGFKGGEVTPLFFIGAALGNALARLLNAPIDLFAGLGFVAVFAGATNTPLACTIMGLELFLPNSPGLLDSGFSIYLAVACFLSYLVSGHSGIYSSQRIGTPKIDSPDVLPETPLRIARELRRATVSPPANRPHPEVVSRTLPTPQKGEHMSDKFPLGAHEIGQLRIFLTPRERRNKGLRSWFGRPLYQEIIHAAKEEGVMNAVAHRMHFGYSAHGKIEHDVNEIPNEYLTLCVELIGSRQLLETFCRRHMELLRDKVAVFEKLERWEIGAFNVVDNKQQIGDQEAA
jgi:H+/Cl- antiporter ClcA/PII-like signaling protein